MNEQNAFKDFKFQLGQLVRHRVTAEAGVVVSCTLIQAQTGNVGRMYTLSFTVLERRREMLEIELEDAGVQ